VRGFVLARLARIDEQNFPDGAQRFHHPREAQVDFLGVARGQGLLGSFDGMNDVVQRTEVEGPDDPGAAVHAPRAGTSERDNRGGRRSIYASGSALLGHTIGGVIELSTHHIWYESE